LALGRWHVGFGGLALADRDGSHPAVAKEALTFLDEAASHFTGLGMDPWLLYVDIQRARALADLQMFDEVNERLNEVGSHLDRFPVLGSFFYEAVAQIQELVGDGDAETSYTSAVEAALASGLRARHERLAAIVESRRGSTSR
jgi:hypothetical protein